MTGHRNNQGKAKKVMVFLLLLCALAVFSTPVIPETRLSKNSKSALAFDESTSILNLGIGIGSRHYFGYGFGYNANRTPAFSISFEKPLSKKLGPGFLGIGAYVGFQHASYRYDNYFFRNERYYYQHNYNYWYLAARGVYHPDALIWEKAEIYFGLMIGLRFQNYKYTSNNPDPDSRLYMQSHSNVYPTYSFLAGARWYFANRAALFGELGYGITYLTLGVSFKL
jgi:hypothetical protein